MILAETISTLTGIRELNSPKLTWQDSVLLLISRTTPPPRESPQAAKLQSARKMENELLHKDYGHCLFARVLSITNDLEGISIIEESNLDKARVSRGRSSKTHSVDFTIVKTYTRGSLCNYFCDDVMDIFIRRFGGYER
ncbi:hypothetical protein CBL_21262 [Carabus blaptoides fortunei]